MNNRFHHVTDPGLREVLEGNVSEDALCIALVVTRKAADKDFDDDRVPNTVALQRLRLAQNAEEAWNEHGDMPGALEFLRQFWMV